MQIITLDLNFQNAKNAIASYLVYGSGAPVMVETGPGSTLETMKVLLTEHGVALSDIKHVLVTHIHLDHAGAAGWWARQGAQIYVHHVGAPHLIDPSKLLASAGRIYGDRMDSLWGEVLSAPAEKVTPLNDGDVLEIEGLSFKAIDTPGHAYHHHTYQVEDVAFTGDAAGIHIPGPAFTDLPAPPPEFNLELWEGTLDRLRGLDIEAIYPTHFGRVDEWTKQIDNLDVLMHKAAEFVRIRLEDGLDRDAIMEDYIAWQRKRAEEAGIADVLAKRYDLANPQYMSVDGLIRYWSKRMAKG
ncbi:MAG: MBL fold metallo-hydrolase [Candidatus Promineifilaceae bacterium]